MFAHSFPFLADQDPLLDTMRGSTEIVGSYVVQTGEVVKEVGEATTGVLSGAIKAINAPLAQPSAKKAPAPKIGLPKLFK